MIMPPMSTTMPVMPFLKQLEDHFASQAAIERRNRLPAHDVISRYLDSLRRYLD